MVTKLLDHVDVHFIPVNNPDGYAYSWAEPDTSHRLWRKNRRPNADGTIGVDLNRNFDFAWSGLGSSSDGSSEIYHGESAFSEPESRAMRDFYESHPNVVGNVDLHSFGQLILGPFAHAASVEVPDQELIDRVGREMENAVIFTNFESYTYQHGWELYFASGIQADWAYASQNVYAYTYELRPGHAYPGFRLPSDEIVPTVTESFSGIVAMLEFAQGLTNGDFNYDSHLDCGDLNQLASRVSEESGPIPFEAKFEFDLSGDGAIHADDLTRWLEINEFSAADANLDGVVDALDRSIWQSNVGENSYSVCHGDFNVDGVVNAADLQVWQQSVPEPGGGVLVVPGFFWCLCMVRRKSRRSRR